MQAHEHKEIFDDDYYDLCWYLYNLSRIIPVCINIIHFFICSADPLSNISLEFQSKEAAIAYAEKQGKESKLHNSKNCTFGLPLTLALLSL